MLDGQPDAAPRGVARGRASAARSPASGTSPPASDDGATVAGGAAASSAGSATRNRGVPPTGRGVGGAVRVGAGASVGCGWSRRHGRALRDRAWATLRPRRDRSAGAPGRARKNGARNERAGGERPPARASHWPAPASGVANGRDDGRDSVASAWSALREGRRRRGSRRRPAPATRRATRPAGRCGNRRGSPARAGQTGEQRIRADARPRDEDTAPAACLGALPASTSSRSSAMSAALA